MKDIAHRLGISQQRVYQIYLQFEAALDRVAASTGTVTHPAFHGILFEFDYRGDRIRKPVPHQKVRKKNVRICTRDLRVR